MTGVGLVVLGATGSAWLVQHLDGSMTRWMAEHRSSAVTFGMDAMTALGSWPILLPIGLGLCAWIRWRLGERHRAWVVGAGLVALDAGVAALKALSSRSRPPAALAVRHFPGWSMPSGHATMSAAVLGTVALTAWRTRSRGGRSVAIACWVLVGAVGLSRVYLGAHWLTDVVAGWTIGSACGLALAPPQGVAPRD